MGGRSLLAYEDDEEDKAPNTLAAYETDDAPALQESAPAQPEGEELEKSILGAILDTAGDMAGTMFNGRAQQYDLPESGPNPGELLLGGGLKGSGFLGKLGASLGNAAIEGGIGAATGAAEGFDDSNEADILGKLLDAGRGAGVEGGVGGGLSLVTDLLGKATGGVGKAASWLARKADNTKAGSTSRIREDLIEKFGIEDGPDRLGELLRHYSPSGLFSPKTSAGHKAAIEQQLEQEGHNLRGMTRQAGEEGADAAAPAAMDGAHDAMLSKAAELDGVARSDSKQAEARKLEALLNVSASKPLPDSFEGLIGAKAQYGEDAFRPVTGFSDEDASSKAAKQAWMTLKDAEGAALSGVTDDTAQRFTDSQGVFSDLSALDESLRPRSSADDAVGNAGTAAVGAVAGAMVPGGQGVMGALTSGTNNAVRQMTGGVAHDLFSNVMHPTGSALQGLGSGLEGAARPAGRIAGDYGAEQSRGHRLSQDVRAALQQDPSAFGKYAQQLQEAEANGTLSTTVSDLDDEYEFRQILRNMRGGG